MVEGGALKSVEAEVLDGLKVAQVGIVEQVKLIADLVKKVGKPKMKWEAPAKKDADWSRP